MSDEGSVRYFRSIASGDEGRTEEPSSGAESFFAGIVSRESAALANVRALRVMPHPIKPVARIALAWCGRRDDPRERQRSLLL